MNGSYLASIAEASMNVARLTEAGNVSLKSSSPSPQWGVRTSGLADFGLQCQAVEMQLIRMLLEPLHNTHAVSAHMGRKITTCFH